MKKANRSRVSVQKSLGKLRQRQCHNVKAKGVEESANRGGESTFFSRLTTSTLASGQIRACGRKEASDQILLPCCQWQATWN